MGAGWLSVCEPRADRTVLMVFASPPGREGEVREPNMSLPQGGNRDGKEFLAKWHHDIVVV